MNWRVMKQISPIALLGALLGWSIVWINQGGELELVHVTRKLEGLSGFLLLVASSTVVSILTAALLSVALPPWMRTAGWRRRIVWVIIGAVLAELTVVPLGLSGLLVGWLAPDPWRLADAVIISSTVWLVFAAPFGAANAALLWKDSFADQGPTNVS
jgi:hypothetical protein